MHGPTPLRPIFAALLVAACGTAPVDPGVPPAEPDAVAVTISPNRVFYVLDQDVTLTGVVTDGGGEVIEGAALSWTVAPDGGAVLGEPTDDPGAAGFRLREEGEVTFTGCVVGAELCDAVTVRVDDGAPVLEVEAPAPGAQLGPGSIVVRGSVADRGMTSLFVNGAALPLDATGSFETELPASFGVQHLDVVATDGVTEASEVELDVLWAEAYQPAVAEDGQSPFVAVEDGIALSLGRRFFDDGRPAVDADPIVTEDLADILELVVARLDITALLPDPVVDDPPTLTLRLPGSTIGSSSASIDITDDGLDLYLRLEDVSVELAGSLMVGDTTLPLDGTVTAAAAVFARLVVEQGDEGAIVELENLTVALEDVAGDFDSEEADAVFALAESLLRGTIEGLLADALDETLAATLPAILNDALGAIDSALTGQEIAIETDLFPRLTLVLGGGFESLTTAAGRDLRGVLALTVTTDQVPRFLDSPGVPWTPEAMDLPLFEDAEVQLGVRLGVLNGLLHVLWNSGLLDIDVAALVPDALAGVVTEGRLVGRLPPVLRPARGEEIDDLVLELGQAELELVFQGEPARFGVTVAAGVSLDVADNAIAIRISDAPDIRVWTLAAPSEGGLLTAEVVQSLFGDLWPELRAALTDGLAFALPLPALGDLGGLAPDLADLQLVLEMQDRLRVRGSSLILDARLVGRTPEPEP